MKTRSMWGRDGEGEGEGECPIPRAGRAVPKPHAHLAVVLHCEETVARVLHLALFLGHGGDHWRAMDAHAATVGGSLRTWQTE